MWSSGPDGHYTYRYARTFTVSTQNGTSYLSGYSETPGALIAIELNRGGGLVGTFTGNSASDGYFGANLTGGAAVEIKPGDTLQVQTSDGESGLAACPRADCGHRFGQQ